MKIRENVNVFFQNLHLIIYLPDTFYYKKLTNHEINNLIIVKTDSVKDIILLALLTL